MHAVAYRLTIGKICGRINEMSTVVLHTIGPVPTCRGTVCVGYVAERDFAVIASYFG